MFNRFLEEEEEEQYVNFDTLNTIYVILKYNRPILKVQCQFIETVVYLPSKYPTHVFRCLTIKREFNFRFYCVYIIYFIRIFY